MFRPYANETNNMNEEDSSYPPICRSDSFDMDDCFDQNQVSCEFYRDECFTPLAMIQPSMDFEPPMHVPRERSTVDVELMASAPLLPLDSDDEDDEDDCYMEEGAFGEVLPPSAMLRPRSSLRNHMLLMLPSLVYSESEEEESNNCEESTIPVVEARKVDLKKAIPFTRSGLKLSNSARVNKLLAMAA